MRSVAAGQAIRLGEAPFFCKAKLTALGSLDTPKSDSALLGQTVVPWTRLSETGDVFAVAQIRGVVTPSGELQWMSDDAELEILDPPRYAGQPEDLIPQADASPHPGGGTEKKPGSGLRLLPYDLKRHPLFENQFNLVQAVEGRGKLDQNVEYILAALAVSPEELRPVLLAGLRARYAELQRKPELYPPAKYAWRLRPSVGPDLSSSLWMLR